jgi:RNA polymerase sigma-70 factor, ECF subfamily
MATLAVVGAQRLAVTCKVRARESESCGVMRRTLFDKTRRICVRFSSKPRLIEVDGSVDNAERPPVDLDRQRIEVLIQQAKDGSPDALGQLLDACRKHLLDTARRAVRAPLRAKFAPSDLVQETSLDAQRDFASFHGERLEELLGWLRTILDYNLASAHRRYQGTEKRRLSREVPLDLHWGGARDLRDPALSPRSLLAMVEDQERLERALHRLPEDLRTAIILRSQKHFSFAEVGIEMQRSADAARKLWGRGVVRLQQELSNPDERTRNQP